MRTVSAICLIFLSLPAWAQEKLDLYGDPLPAGADARLGTIRLRHGNDGSPYFVRPKVTFSDNRTIVSVFGRSIHFYASDSGELLRSLNLKKELVRHVQISPDRRLLAVQSAVPNQATQQVAYSTRIWKIATGELQSTLDGNDHFSMSAFTSDGKTYFTLDQEIVKFWDVSSGKLLLTYKLETDSSVTNLDVSPLEDQLIAFTTNSDIVYLWDWLSGKPPAILTRDWPVFYSVRFSPTQSQLAVIAHAGRRVQIWNTKTLKLDREIKSSAVHRLDLCDVEFTPDGRNLIGTQSTDPQTDKTGIVLWDIASGKVKQVLSDRSSRSDQLIVSPDGKRLALASSCLKVWNLETGECLSDHLTGHEAQVNSVVFTPDSKNVVTAAADGSVRVWNSETGRQVHELPHEFETKLLLPFQPETEVRAAVVSPNGTRIASFGSDNVLHVWDIETGQELHRLSGHESRGNDFALSFSPDNKKLASFGSDMYVRLWDVSSGEKLEEHTVRPSEHPNPFDRVSKILGKNQRPVRVSALIGSPAKGLLGVEFSKNAEWLVLNYYETVHIINVATGYEVTKFSESFYQRSIAFSPTGRLVLVVGSRTVKKPDATNNLTRESCMILRSLTAGREIWRETLPANSQSGPVAFSPDGRLIAVGIPEPVNEIRIWDVKTKKPLTIKDVPGIEYGNTLAFSADNRKLACAQTDYSVLIWDLLEEGLPESLIAKPEQQDEEEGGSR